MQRSLFRVLENELNNVSEFINGKSSFHVIFHDFFLQKVYTYYMQ